MENKSILPSRCSNEGNNTTKQNGMTMAGYGETFYTDKKSLEIYLETFVVRMGETR